MFTKKHIVQPERIGTKLRTLRESAGFTIDELADKTKLHADSIYALETCAFHRLPQEPVYQRLYIKRYAMGIGVDPAPLLKQFQDEELHRTVEAPQMQSSLRARRWLRHRPTLFSLGITLLTLFCFFSYIGVQINNLYKAPHLTLSTPEDGAVNESGIANIAGVTDPEVSVFINGEQVRSAEDGQFHASIDLQPGVNTILVSAKKRHGTESNITKYVLYRETTQVSLGDTLVHN